MISLDSNFELFKELKKVHLEADNATKEAERRNGEIAIPAIKELRDAFHHLDNLLFFENEEEQKNELYKAISHCKRAYFDARECTFLYQLESVNKIQESAGDYLFVLKNYIPEYHNHKKAILDAKKFNEKVAVSNEKDRKEYYKECDIHISALGAFLDAYSISEEEIKQDINGRKKRSFWYMVGPVIGALGVIVAIIAIIW